MNPRLTPEIMEALARRRAGGVGGGSTIPAAQQTMAPNPWGGPLGPMTSPLQSAPQAVPAPPIPMAGPQQQSMPQGPSQMPQQPQAGQASQGQPSAQVDPQTKDMTKALMQRLIRFL